MTGMRRHLLPYLAFLGCLVAFGWATQYEGGRLVLSVAMALVVGGWLYRRRTE